MGVKVGRLSLAQGLQLHLPQAAGSALSARSAPATLTITAPSATLTVTAVSTTLATTTCFSADAVSIGRQ